MSMNAPNSKASNASENALIPRRSYASLTSAPSSALAVANYHNGSGYNTVPIRYEHVGMPFGFDIKKINVIEREKVNTNEYVFKRYLEEVHQHEILSLITNVVHSHPDYATVRKPEFSKHMCALTIGGHPEEFDVMAYSALKEDGSADALKKAEEMYLAVLKYDSYACCTLCANITLCNLYIKYAIHFKNLKYSYSTLKRYAPLYWRSDDFYQMV